MNRLNQINKLRKNLQEGKPSLGSWMQLPDASVAELMGDAGYDWVAVDLEHGSIDTHQLPQLFRALELGGCLPLARVAQGHEKDCKQALDAGAAGLIVPMVETSEQMQKIKDASCWPPTGKRGVGFSRANKFGKYFDTYREEAQSPLLIAQIEHIRGVENLDQILKVPGLDAILIGPYDLSASMGLTAEFQHPKFQEKLKLISEKCRTTKIPLGIHIVNPSEAELMQRLEEGFQFIAYGIDAVFLRFSATAPDIKKIRS